MTTRRTLRQDIRAHVLAGSVVLAVLAAGLGGWAARTEIAGAVVAQGTLVVESNVKKIQHPAGGVVAAIHVQEGKTVRKDDVLLRLDDTIARANLAIVRKSLAELDARQARLKAERDDAATISFTPASAGDHGREAIEEEQRLFDIRRAARLGQKAQLAERANQMREELNGLDAQVATKTSEIELVGRELDDVRSLWRKNLVPVTRLMTLEREAVRIAGERAVLRASIAQAKGRITEIDIQIGQIDRDLRAETSRELREVQARIAELAERQVAAEDQLRRIDIVAPQDGIVHQLSVHTIGGVIGAAEQLMLIVPGTDQLQVEVRIAPHEIDQVSIGQTAILRLAAFNQRTTPELSGTLTTVAADTSADQKTGAVYYTGRITISSAEVARLRDLRLTPGMPATVYLHTVPRTVLSYLVKPVEDQMTRALRER